MPPWFLGQAREADRETRCAVVVGLVLTRLMPSGLSQHNTPYSVWCRFPPCSFSALASTSTE